MSKGQNPTDRYLIVQYRAGDVSVLPVLVKRYHRIFCEKAYWVLKDKEAAKDIAQESWITIINKLHTLDNVDSFKSWALRIVFTKAVDGVKRRKKENDHLRSVKVQDSCSEPSEAERELVRKELLAAIRDLPRGKQDIIRLFYAEDYSIGEISDFLNIPKGTVKSRLFKAREKLKLILKKSKS